MCSIYTQVIQKNKLKNLKYLFNLLIINKMKKVFLLISSALVLMLSGCVKEVATNENSGEEVSVSFSMSLPEVSTKATADGDGAAVKVNHWIMEVRDAQNDLFIRQEHDAKEGVKSHTFKFNLFKNQTYTLQFWADTKGAYVTADLTAITASDAIGNKDSRDAFSANVSYKCERSESKTITLYRPFAQINVITTDLESMKGQVKTEAVYMKYIPKDLKMTATVPSTFNVQTQTASALTKTTVTAEKCYADFKAAASATTIYMDYIFASADEKDVVDMAFCFKSNSVATSYDFTSIPLQRNYRTNIKGNLMSEDAEWVVTIDPTWSEPEYNVPFTDAFSIAAANVALGEGKTAIEIKNPEDAVTPIVLPAAVDGKDVSLNLSGVSGKTITIVTDEGANGPKNLYINSDAANLDITAKNSHVEINKGAYTSVAATTSANALVIGKDVTVDALNIKAGNAEIYGKVASLERAEGIVVKMYASDRATLINYINWAKTGDTICLACDIDLAGENWTPLRSGNRFTATFDGQGYTIKNMTISTDMTHGAGFFSDMTGGAVIKNFTIDGADVSNTTADTGNIYGIVSGYAYGNVTFENVNVKNSKIHAFGKVAAILGMAADPGGKTVLKNCSVKDVNIIGCYNVANFVGLLQNEIEITGCTFSNVTKTLGGRYGEDSYVTFDNEPVIDAANFKYVTSSGKYWKNGSTYYSAFADYYNDKYYCGWLAKDGSVDGLVVNSLEAIELSDFVPAAIIGETKYIRLDDAIKAVTTGQTIEIMKDIDGGEFICYDKEGGNFTINGNNHTIKNLNVAPSAKGCSGLVGYATASITINDLTVEGCTFTGKYTTTADDFTGAAAFIGLSDVGSETFTNCKSIDNVCTGAKYAGGIVGYTSGCYDIDGVEVTGCTITSAYKGAGAVFGFCAPGTASATGVIDNLIVKDNAISSATTQRVGVLYGRINAGTNTLKANRTISGNTLNGTSDNTTFYGDIGNVNQFVLE